MTTHKKKTYENKRNSDLIKKFNKKLDFENKSDTTIEKTIPVLKTLSRHLKKDFKKATEDEIIDYLKKYSVTTRVTRLAIIRTFYRYIFKLNRKKVPECLKRIEFPKIKYDNIRHRERVITEEEYNLIIKNCKTPKERAIVEALYNFGVREDEVTSPKIKDVIYNGVTTTMAVRVSKTETRDVKYEGRSRYLLEWTETLHPYKDEGDLPLFYSHTKNKGYTKAGIYFMIKRISKRAGLKRNITVHDFRHTCITNHCKNGTPHTHIQSNMGLTKDTKMLRVYDHNKSKDYEDYLRQKSKDTPATYDTIKEKHQKEIDDLKAKMMKFEEFFAGSTIEKTEDGMFLVNNDAGIINAAHPNKDIPDDAYSVDGSKKTGFKIVKTKMKLVSTSKNGIESWKPK